MKAPKANDVIYGSDNKCLVFSKTLFSLDLKTPMVNDWLHISKRSNPCNSLDSGGNEVPVRSQVKLLFFFFFYGG